MYKIFINIRVQSAPTGDLSGIQVLEPISNQDSDNTDHVIYFELYIIEGGSDWRNQRNSSIRVYFE